LDEEVRMNMAATAVGQDRIGVGVEGGHGRRAATMVVTLWRIIPS